MRRVSMQKPLALLLSSALAMSCVAKVDDSASVDERPEIGEQRQADFEGPLKTLNDVSGLVANVFGAGQAASFVISTFLSISGLIGDSEHDWKQDFKALHDQIDSAVDSITWVVTEQERENRYADIFADVMHAAQTVALGKTFDINDGAFLDAHHVVEEATTDIAFRRVFTEGATDAHDNDYNGGGFYQSFNWKSVITARAEELDKAHHLVYDYRPGIPHLLNVIALRIQIIAAADPNFLTDGVFFKELKVYRAALQDHLGWIHDGVHCGFTADDVITEPENCQENGGCTPAHYYTQYRYGCADIYTGAADLGLALTAVDQRADNAWFQTNVQAPMDAAKRRVLARMPLFAIQSMIDTLTLYTSGTHDLTTQQPRLRVDANQSLCLDLVGNSDSNNGTPLVIATCDRHRLRQQWSYDRVQQRLVNLGTNKCLDVYYANQLQGTKADISDCNGTDAQKWTWNPESKVLTNKLGNVLDVQNGKIAAGVPVWTWVLNGGDAQRWFADQAPLPGEVINVSLDTTSTSLMGSQTETVYLTTSSPNVSGPMSINVTGLPTGVTAHLLTTNSKVGDKVGIALWADKATTTNASSVATFSATAAGITGSAALSFTTTVYQCFPRTSCDGLCGKIDNGCGGTLSCAACPKCKAPLVWNDDDQACERPVVCHGKCQ